MRIDSQPPVKSLADRISSADVTSEKKKEGEENKASTTSQSSPQERKTEEKDTKEPETNLIPNKYEVAVKLQDLQADPNSPLYSVKSFEELGLYILLCLGI